MASERPMRYKHMNLGYCSMAVMVLGDKPRMHRMDINELPQYTIPIFDARMGVDDYVGLRVTNVGRREIPLTKKPEMISQLVYLLRSMDTQIRWKVKAEDVIDYIFKSVDQHKRCSIYGKANQPDQAIFNLGNGVIFRAKTEIDKQKLERGGYHGDLFMMGEHYNSFVYHPGLDVTEYLAPDHVEEVVRRCFEDQFPWLYQNGMCWHITGQTPATPAQERNRAQQKSKTA